MMEDTLEKLRTLKLPEMAKQLEKMLENPTNLKLPWDEVISMVVDAEYLSKGNKRIAALLKKARLKYPGASLESLKYDSKRGLIKQNIKPLADLSFVQQAHNVCISGATGTGKSYLACTLANLSCRAGINTLYSRIGSFLDELVIEKALGNYAKSMARLRKIKLLILDDMGADTLSKDQRGILLDVVDDFYLERSLIITSQVPAEKWDLVIGDPSTAEAVCDRLFHYCHRINLKGGSMRREKIT